MKKNDILAAIYTTTMAKKQQRFLAVLLVFISLIFHYSNAMAQNGPVPVAFQKVIVGTTCKGVTTVGSHVAVATGNGLRFSNDSGTTFTTYTTADGLTSDSVSCVSSYHPYGEKYAGTNNGINGIIYDYNNESSYIYSFPSNFGLGSNNIQSIYADGYAILASTKNGLGISFGSGANYFENKTIWDGLGSNSVNGAFYVNNSNYNNNVVYAATDGGLSFANRDGDAYFVNKTTSDGLGSNKVNGVIVSNGTIYAATDGGLSISTDGGTSFTNKTTVQGLASNIVNSVFVDGNTVYVATNGGLSISSDGGLTFTTLITNIPIYGVHASTSKVYVAALDGLYRSCDPSYSTETKDTCGSYTWNGQTYTSSGTYTWTGTNATGCDSTATLNLTIKQTSTSSTTISRCGSYTWNGQTYNSSGTYTWIGTNSVGCDSTATLNLTINQPNTSTTAITRCGSYNWNGQTYTSSGTYTWTGTNAAGCDSVATLNLTINDTTSSSASATACGSYTWKGQTYTSSGVYTWSGTNAAGCDSVVTLNLTINVGTFNAETRVETSGYTWNGTLYAVSGTYTYSYSNSNGCNSVDTLYLVVNNTTSSVNVKNVCTYIGTNETLTYTASVVGASSYTWSLPANTQLVSGQGTRSILIKFLNGFAAQANKQIRVTPAGGSLQIIYTNAQAPVTPATIVASSTNICQSLGTNVPITFTVPRVFEPISNGRTTTSYLWTAQNGTTTISHPNGIGENDTTVAVTFDANFTTSSITVQSVNACGVSAIRSYLVSRSNPSVGVISGPTNSCEYIGTTGAIAIYSAPAVTNINSYTWTIPTGATNVSGQGTNTISFKYPEGYTGGSISVTGTNGCGTSAARTLSINRLLPGAIGNIDIINTQVCPNREFSYSLASIPGNATSLLWTVPAGGTLVSGQGTRSITVSYFDGVVNGTVTVKAVSNCGTSGIRSLIVKLAPCSANPGNTYTKGVINNTPSSMEVTVFPNPTTSLFNVKVTTSSVEKAKARLLDVQGRLIKTISINPNETITLGTDLKSGVYMLEVLQGEERKMVRVVKY
jgi:hypothetical protein